MHIFWEKGFEGASLNELTGAMGIKPASLYAAFGNKQALFECALNRYLAGPVAFMRAALEQPCCFLLAHLDGVCAWQRVGRHTESGTYSAVDWLKIYAEHLEIHARQIEDNVTAWGAASGRPTSAA